MVKLCECGNFIDESWKTLCLKCFLKENNPEAYKKNFEIGEVTCKRCGEKFIDDLWDAQI